jgi:pyruvate kinase
MLSRLRPNLSIFALTSDKKLKNRLCLVYGVILIYLNTKPNIYLPKNQKGIKNCSKEQKERENSKGEI